MGYNRGYNDRPREMHDAVCAKCKKETQVPFKPDGDRPVYCRECYQSQRKPRY
ncbi:MAG: CxxC-x17-CxxC domain-containing protein [Candidatus Heimdallarchaeaceae archaeon]